MSVCDSEDRRESARLEHEAEGALGQLSARLAMFGCPERVLVSWHHREGDAVANLESRLRPRSTPIARVLAESLARVLNGDEWAAAARHVLPGDECRLNRAMQRRDEKHAWVQVLHRLLLSARLLSSNGGERRIEVSLVDVRRLAHLAQPPKLVSQQVVVGLPMALKVDYATVPARS